MICAIEPPHEGPQGEAGHQDEHEYLREASVQNKEMRLVTYMVRKKLRAVFKTAWEMKQRHLIDMAADRGAFICQSQSLNLFVESPDYAKLSSMHFYAWKKGLKTGMYYLRTRAASSAIQFTVDQEKRAAKTKTDDCIAGGACAAGVR